MSDDTVTILPDGSAFFTASLPLPKDHWLYAPRAEGWDVERDTSISLGRTIVRIELKEIRDRLTALQAGAGDGKG